MAIPLVLAESSEEPIPLASKVGHKFYEPIVLTISLVDSIREIVVPLQPDEPIEPKDDKQVFYAVVNKICHVCDHERGGDTVTSCFILLDEDQDDYKVHYHFASNKRSYGQLEETAAFVANLFSQISDASRASEQQDSIRRELLSAVVRINRPRISFYLENLQPQIAECLRICGMENTAENLLIAEKLRSLVDSTSVGVSLKAPETEYVRAVNAKIRLLILFRQSEVYDVIKKRVLDARMRSTSTECYAKFLHTTSRILAYPQSVQFLLMARDRWPILFDKPAITFHPSSRPFPKPIRNKSLTAEGIISRMTRKEKIMQIFKSFVKTLQLFELDNRIKREYHKDTFRPIVHSEVQLLNWLKNKGLIEPSRFFGDWMYIGSSKPVCKLCDYYFLEHKSGVEHRSSHGNLYAPWRLPDVYPSQGLDALNDRQVMLDRVLQRVRQDAFDIVRKKVPAQFKAEDSCTFSATVTLQERWTVETRTDIDDITSVLGQTVLGDPD